MKLANKILSVFKTSQAGTLIYLKEREEGGDALACIAMVMSHYGISTSLNALLSIYPGLRKGAGLKHIITIFNTHNFQVRALHCPVNELSKLRLPAILHWRMERFVVLGAVNENSVVIYDPSSKILKIKMDELEHYFAEIVLEILPPS